MYDAGRKQEKYSNFLAKTLLELKNKHSFCIVGGIFSSVQPNLKHLIAEGIVKQIEIIVPANIDPYKCLESVVCEELDRLPLDHPTASVENDELFKGVKLLFNFKRKHPLVRYSVSYKEEDCKIQHASSHSGLGQSDDDNSDNDVLLQIQPSPSTQYPSVLVTGKAPAARLAKAGAESLSVFMVPHQEGEECLSLLPDDRREQLSNSASLKNAALHLALYHKRNSFSLSLDKLKGTKLKEKGKDFRTYYFDRDCQPEADLQAMLQDPEAKISPFLCSDNYQLNWYKKQKNNVFSEIEKAVSEEEGKQFKRMVFLCGSLAWAHCYKNICAEVYVISAEDLKQEHHLKVLNGIIIASIWRKTKCCILVTNSLSLPLDEIFQRDVRKLAFPGGKTKPKVCVGFLNQNSPFFTINPWSESQQYASQHHTVSVNTSEHSVTNIGNEPKLNLIRDDLDLLEKISTKHSNEIISASIHSRRPTPTSMSGESAHLSDYFRCIGHTSKSYGMEVVLGCVVGHSIVEQLKCFASEDLPSRDIIPALLKQKAHGNSIFTLTPTKSSATEASIIVNIPPNKYILVGEKKVQSAKFQVKRARTMSVDITLGLKVDSKSLTIKLSKFLDLHGSCGKTVADHIFSVCYKESAWLHFKDLTVGEVLLIILKNDVNALLAVKSLPLFFSFPLLKSKIFHCFTRVLADSSQIQEAHLYSCPFELSPVIINKCKLKIQVESLNMQQVMWTSI